MTKKIGISLRDDLYEWAVGEIDAGRAESVSAMLAEGLEIMQARAELAALVKDLEEEAGEPDEETQAWIDEAMRASDRAARKHGAKRSGHAA